MESLQTVSTFQTWGINCFQRRSGKINGEKLVSECHEKPGAFLKKTALLLDKQSVTAKTYCKVSKWFSNHQVHAVEHSWTNEKHCSLESPVQRNVYKQWASKMQFWACKHSRSRLFSRELRKITQVPGMVHFTSHLNTSSLASKHLSV